jgi:hypothetical protein
MSILPIQCKNHISLLDDKLYLGQACTDTLFTLENFATKIAVTATVPLLALDSLEGEGTNSIVYHCYWIVERS